MNFLFGPQGIKVLEKLLVYGEILAVFVKSYYCSGQSKIFVSDRMIDIFDFRIGSSNDQEG